MSDYYNLLEIAPGASTKEIRRAFRARAKQAHPDAHPHLKGMEKEAMRRRFIQLAQAYETLSDPGRRKAYDRQWRVRHGRGEAGRPQAHARRRERSRPAWPGEDTGTGKPARPADDTGTAKPGRPAEPTAEEHLEDLLGDVEDLLAGFGLNLRQPFEELLDALLEWAMDVFRLVGTGKPARPAEDSATGKPARPAEDSATGKPARPGENTTEAWLEKERSAEPAGANSEHAGAGKTQRSRAKEAREGAQPAPGAPGNEKAGDGVQAELEALKARVRSGKTAAPNTATLEDELRRIKRKLGKEG